MKTRVLFFLVVIACLKELSAQTISEDMKNMVLYNQKRVYYQYNECPKTIEEYIEENGAPNKIRYSCPFNDENEAITDYFIISVHLHYDDIVVVLFQEYLSADPAERPTEELTSTLGNYFRTDLHFKYFEAIPKYKYPGDIYTGMKKSLFMKNSEVEEIIDDRYVIRYMGIVVTVFFDDLYIKNIIWERDES